VTLIRAEQEGGPAFRGQLTILKELLTKDIVEIQDQVKVLTVSGARFVHRRGRARFHVIAQGPPAATSCWRTSCGWHFASAKYVLASNAGALKCRRCFKAPVVSTENNDDTKSSSGSGG